VGHPRQLEVGACRRDAVFGLGDSTFGFRAGGLRTPQVGLEILAVQHDDRLAGVHAVAGLRADLDDVGGDFCGDRGAIAGAHSTARPVDLGDLGRSHGLHMHGDGCFLGARRRDRRFQPKAGGGHQNQNGEE
jgi:hypothetical protein